MNRPRLIGPQGEDVCALAGLLFFGWFCLYGLPMFLAAANLCVGTRCL
jgi:hypothetical protein